MIIDFNNGRIQVSKYLNIVYYNFSPQFKTKYKTDI